MKIRYSIIVVLFVTGLLSSCKKKSNDNPTPITPGIVTTFAGSGSIGSTNGSSTTASFHSPTGIGIDAQGNLYVSDVNNNIIRKITAAGIVSTFAGSGVQGLGDGPASTANFNIPSGIAIDASGNVYVADSYNNIIRQISGGIVNTYAGIAGSGGKGNGSASNAYFLRPSGLAVDASGNLYVSDSGNNLIRKITPAGNVTTFAGSGVNGHTDGTGTAASFDSPAGITIDASGNIYVSDSGNNLIRKITSGGVVSTLAGSGAAGSSNGTGSAATFYGPQGITVDASGNVYVVDTGNNLIRKVTASGVVTTLAGSGKEGSTNGTGTDASFYVPIGITIDAVGNLYVTDSSSELIRKITT